MGLTRELAERIAGIDYETLPREAVQTVKRGIIDCVGVLFAGRDEPVVRILLQDLAPGNEATVLFGERKARSADAALLNATAGHALDYDDVAIDGHPSVVLTPAILAEGERLGVSGKELIAAYVAGYETWAELVSRDADKYHGKGWHPTAVFGTVGAAAAASRLGGLDVQKTTNALAIAASMAGGVGANFGTMTKPFHAGRAAQSGIQAARLAAAGMTASPDALEHRIGFLAAFSPQGRIDVERSVQQDAWHILRHGLNIKRYPVCYALHRSIDAVVAMKAAAADVQSVEMHIGKLQAGMLRHSSPQNALDAKFSAQFAMAAALTTGKVGLAELTDGFVQRKDVQALMPKVRVATTEATDPDDPLFAAFDYVTVNGVKSREIRHAKGHARNPLTLDELREKFDDCTGGRQRALFEKLLTLESWPDVSRIGV
jgi:aconitate decarboxylase